MKKYKNVFCGLFIGLINGILGAGGGMLAVPYLKSIGFNQKQAHENAVAVILPISIVSAAVYVIKGYVTVKESLIYLPGGVIGAVFATYVLKNINPKLLKKVFGIFALYAGVRLWIK